MAIRTARAEWTGDFAAGTGTIVPGSGSFEACYSAGSIYQKAPGSNPIEMLAASVAGCYCGGLAAVLSKSGCVPDRVCAEATVNLDPSGNGFRIAGVHLLVKADVPGIDESTFLDCAERAKQICPVLQALEAIEITLEAELD